VTEQAAFDPRSILAALDRNYVAYVLIGGLARVIRGTDEVTRGVDVSPSLRPENLERLGRALVELDARQTGRGKLDLEKAIRDEPVLSLTTAAGELTVVPEPAGTRRGYDDLRRAATREHIGHGLRPNVASVADLARMTAALGRAEDAARLRELRRIMEVEVRLPRSLGLEL
jgi:hypothetical protein